MSQKMQITRRSVLLGAGGVAGAAGLALAGAPAASAAPSQAYPLWKTAAHRGILYGSSTATWQLDPGYRKLFRQQAALLFTEDDLLWYRLKPTPSSPLNFVHSDRIIAFAEANDQLVFGAHLVWDDGFGSGWTHHDLWGLSEMDARRLLYGTLRAVMDRYRGRVAIWSVVNEAIVNGTDQGYRGLRKDVPWFQTIGPEYVAHAFYQARAADPDAALVMNDFGYETTDQYHDLPKDKMRATLQVLDRLLGQGAPVDAFGIQAHLLADRFEERFHPKQYLAFLRELSGRGLKIFITEMDVLDDGLPKAIGPRDRQVADVYRRYLDVALQELDVAVVVNFGLSDRYTWLDEDYPRADGAHRRPLPFDRALQPTPSYYAIRDRLHHAPWRPPMFDQARHAAAAQVAGS